MSIQAPRPDSEHAGRPTRRVRGVARRAARPPLILGSGVLLLTALTVGVWTGYEAHRLHGEATAAVRSLHGLDLSAAVGDRNRVNDAAVHAERAAAAADSLPIRAAAALPLVGDDVRAARILARSLDTVVSEAAVPMTTLLDRVTTKSKDAPAGAMLNTAPLRTAGPAVKRAATAVTTARARLAALDTGSLAGPVRRPVTQAQRRLTSLGTTLTTASTSLPALGDLLGADGRRQYLLVFQNLAESRPTGGLIGKWATVNVDRSAVRMTGIGTNEDLTSLRLHGVPSLPSDYRAMYGAGLGPVANANLSPDFPTAARIVLATWRQQGHRTPTGVISVDTRAISGLLGLTGPIRLPGPRGPVTVSATNVVDVVQNRVYGWFEGDETRRQRFLSALTSTTFTRLASGGIGTRDLAPLVTTLLRNRDVMAYATDPQTQRALVALGAAGTLPAPRADRVQVHFTDNGGGKLDNYLATAACTAPGTVGVKLTNRLPSDYAGFVPPYALNQRAGVPGGTNLLTMAVYLPAGRGMSRVTVNGRPTSVAAGSEKTWSVVRIPLQIPATSTVTVLLTLSGTGPTPHLVTQALTQDVAPAIGLCNR